MNEITGKLNLDKSLIEKTDDLAHKDKVNVLACAEKCNCGDYSCLEGRDGIFCLAVVLECLSHTKADYERLGIDEKVFYDTMSDIKIWCENFGNKGLLNINWIKNHLSCQLFRIGRLQFQFYICNNEFLDYELLPFAPGEKLIYVHIPQGEKLVYADCVESIKNAVEFFKTYFPEYEYEFFFCESWLLYDDNWMFMERSSNILEFSTLFDVMYSVDDDSQAIERIFGKRRKTAALYPSKTTLQKNVKAHLRKGGRLGVGIGIIDKQCFE